MAFASLSAIRKESCRKLCSGCCGIMLKVKKNIYKKFDYRKTASGQQSTHLSDTKKYKTKTKINNQ